MDSRLLYNVSDHLTKVIHWDKDWIHFGTDNEINYDLINN